MKWYNIVGIIAVVFIALFMVDVGMQDNESCCTPEDVFIPNHISILFPVLFLILIMIWMGASIESEIKR